VEPKPSVMELPKATIVSREFARRNGLMPPLLLCTSTSVRQ